MRCAPALPLCSVAILAILACGCGDSDEPRRPSLSTTAHEQLPGGRILFVRYLTPDRSAAAIFSVAPDGSAERQVTRPPDGATDGAAGWSPSGDRFAFTRCRIVCALWTARPDGSAPHALSRACDKPPPRCDERSEPSFSPDGRRIAFGRAWGRIRDDIETIQYADIYTSSATGGDLRRLTHFPAYSGDANGAAWSPDGKRLVFNRTTSSISKPPNRHAVFVINADGSALRRLTPWRLNGGDGPDWSPDGSRILFRAIAAEEGPSGDLYTVNPDGTNLTRLTRQSDKGGVLSASFSPDGKWVAFGRPGTQGEPDVFVMHTPNGAPQAVTRTPHWDSGPEWGR